MPPSEPSPTTRATRLARPGADSAISVAMPSRASTSARKRAPAISLPGGFVVSIARYRRSSATFSSPRAAQSIIVLSCGRLARGRGRPADVHVRAGGHAGLGGAEREKRDRARAQELHERAALGAVGVHRDVERLVVIEAEAVVHRRLPARTDRQWTMEALGEEALERGKLGQGPRRAAVVTDERGARAHLARRRGRQGRQLAGRLGLRRDHLRLAHGGARALGVVARGGQRALGALDLGGRHQSLGDEHTSELQSLTNLVCRLLLEKKKPRFYRPRMLTIVGLSMMCRRMAGPWQ